MANKVAFIGLGAMGGPMAINLVRAGIELTVFDISEPNLTRVVEAGGFEQQASPRPPTMRGLSERFYVRLT